jgi:hypothetical protein
MTTATEEITLPELAQELGITHTAQRIDTPENAGKWEKTANAYGVSLRYQGRKMSFVYYQGTGIKTEPSCADLVHCLSSDLNILNSCETYECFVGCFGLDIYSHKIYAHLKKQGARYEKLIGNSDVLSQLLEMEY